MDMTLTKQQIARVLKRLEYEIETIREEGFLTPQYWYVADRLAKIQGICAEAIAGNPLACVHDDVNASEDDAKRFDDPHLDSYLDRDS